MSDSRLSKQGNMLNREGIYGLGFSNNNNLDLMNIVLLAIAGVIIKIFFSEGYTESGNIGPASTTIWGYGLSAIAIFIMLFMSFFLSNKVPPNLKTVFKNETAINYVVRLISLDSIPIFLSLLVLIYIISLNFIYFTRINSNTVTDSYHSYSLVSSVLIILQILLISKYMFNILLSTSGDKEANLKEYNLIKGISFILVTINFIFIFIIHILLEFYSTDG